MNREKESGFNPRMNTETQTKSIYKMNNKELEIENKNLENELKKNKIKGFKLAINKTRQEISPSRKNQANTKSNKTQLHNSNGKIKIIENYKTSATNQNNLYKNDTLFDPHKDQSNINSNISPRTNHSNNTNRSNSFLSFNNEISINKSNNPNPTRNITTDNDSHIYRSNSNNKITSFKSKLQTKQQLRQGENLFSTPDFDIKTNKVTKNLIPIPRNFDGVENNFHNHDHNYNTHNKSEKISERNFELNVNSKESNSENYNQRSNSNSHKSHTHEQTHLHVKALIDKMRLCQKVNLPSEKNYFISEKNLKLIKDALSEKDHDINNLKSLLSLTKDDIDAYQKRYDDLCGIVKELSDEKNIILSNLEKLFIENKQLKENYDDFAFQYNKMLIYFKTIDKFILLVLKWFDSFCDIMKCQDETESGIISISPHSRFLEFFRQIEKFTGEENLRSFNFLFTQSVLKKAPTTFKNVHSNSNIFYDTVIESTFSNSQNFLFSEVDVEYFRMEKMNRQLKNKIYDYESFIKKLTHIYETKNVDLTEVAKDMITTKKRIAELNCLNDNLEKENDYLRITYHNLFTAKIQEEQSQGNFKENSNFDLNMYDNQNSKKIEKFFHISTLQEEFNKIKSNYEKLQKENLELQDLLEIINQKNSEMKFEIESLNEESKKLKEENDFNKIEAKRILTTTISTDKYNEKINQLHVQISKLNETIKEKDNIISDMRMRLIDFERNNSMVNQKPSSLSSKSEKIFYNKEHTSENQNSEISTKDKINNNVSDKKIKKSQNKSWNEYLNQSDSNESCVMCIDLNRKILKYQLEIECLKNNKINKDNMNMDLNEFMKSNKKSNLNQDGNFLNVDLIMVCYNQSKIIENIEVN